MSTAAAASPGRVAVLAGVGLLVAVAMLAIAHGGPSYFLQLGDRSHNLGLARSVLGDDIAVPLEDGHDGENFWVLARDPLLLDEATSDRFDRPTYRAQRIGYPWAAAPWRLGGEMALLWGLVLTNVAAAACGTWAAARLAVANGRPATLGYAFAFNPLVLVAVLFDFSDALALAGVVGALLALRARRHGLVVASGVVACLAKESSLIALGAAAVLTRGVPPRARLALVLPGAVAAGAWRLYVIGRPGFGSDPEVQEFELVPFSGFVDAWHRSWEPGGQWLDAGVALLLVGFGVVALVSFVRSRRCSALLAAALGPVLVLPFLSAQVVGLWTNSLRAAGPAITLGILGVAASRRAVT